MADLLTVSALTIAILMGATWVVSVVVDDVSIVDIVWGFGFVAAIWAAYLSTGAQTTNRTVMMLTLVTVWGLRLTGYLGWRKAGKGEDRRYQQMRKKSPDSFWLSSLVTVFALQAAIMWVVSMPTVLTMGRDGALIWLDYLGAALWMVGLTFEAVGDFQLARFKARADSKRKVLDTGLWRYTRHPNYFGDFCVWWGIYLVAASAGLWWTVFAPLVMSALLMKYSGAGLVEKTITRRRPEYDEYIRTTNGFFPGPPKRAS